MLVCLFLLFVYLKKHPPGLSAPKRSEPEFVTFLRDVMFVCSSVASVFTVKQDLSPAPRGVCVHT